MISDSTFINPVDPSDDPLIITPTLVGCSIVMPAPDFPVPQEVIPTGVIPTGVIPLGVIPLEGIPTETIDDPPHVVIKKSQRSLITLVKILRTFYINALDNEREILKKSIIECETLIHRLGPIIELETPSKAIVGFNSGMKEAMKFCKPLSVTSKPWL